MNPIKKPINDVTYLIYFKLKIGFLPTISIEPM